MHASTVGWRALNRLRTGVGRAKTVMRRWGYLDDAQSVDCDCGEPQTMACLQVLVEVQAIGSYRVEFAQNRWNMHEF